MAFPDRTSPGFWGPGHSPFTHKVSDHTSANLARMAGALGLYTESVTAHSEIIPALQRAFDKSTRNRPAYVEFIASQYPIDGGWIHDPASGH